MRTVLGLVGLVVLAWIAVVITCGYHAGRVMLKGHDGLS
jgi:hypothetical protein